MEDEEDAVIARIMVLRNRVPVEVGSVSVSAGRAEPSSGKIGDMLARMMIVEPDHPEHVLTFADGAEYVKALEFNIAGTYMWAEVEP